MGLFHRFFHKSEEVSWKWQDHKYTVTIPNKKKEVAMMAKTEGKTILPRDLLVDLEHDAGRASDMAMEIAKSNVPSQPNTSTEFNLMEQYNWIVQSQMASHYTTGFSTQLGGIR